MTQEDLDYQHLQHELDRCKAAVFRKGNSAFLGPLLCSMEIIWDANVETACTDGISIWWNPHWFLSLSPITRVTVLVHEVWHPAGLHHIRKGTRDPKIWNYACDLWINNDLERQNYSFEGIEWCWKDQQYGTMAEEEIYDILIANSIEPPPSSFGEDDMKEPTEAQIQQVVSNVSTAIHQATLAGGTVPSRTRETLGKFLEPKVEWEKALQDFCNDLLEEDYSWRIPSRRSQEVYLPSRVYEDGKLEHLIYYLDVSGSCSNQDVLRFNSEVKYIKDTFNPLKLTIVQFTTEICHEQEFLESDPFDTVVRYGSGGTHLECVRQHMMLNRPTAAIIFSDLGCPIMQPLDFEVPTIWVAIRAAGKSVPFGKLIHIRN